MVEGSIAGVMMWAMLSGDGSTVTPGAGGVTRGCSSMGSDGIYRADDEEVPGVSSSAGKKTDDRGCPSRMRL